MRQHLRCTRALLTLSQVLAISFLVLGSYHLAFAAEDCDVTAVFDAETGLWHAETKSDRSGNNKYCPLKCTFVPKSKCASATRVQNGVPYIVCLCLTGSTNGPCKRGFHSDGSGDGSYGIARCVVTTCPTAKECYDIHASDESLECDCDY